MLRCAIVLDIGDVVSSCKPPIVTEVETSSRGAMLCCIALSLRVGIDVDVWLL